MGDEPALLEYANLTPDWINWQIWLRQTGFADISAWSTIPCNSYVHSVGKALKGEGIVLASSDLLETEFQSGKLVRIGEVGLTPKKSYFLCCKENEVGPKRCLELAPSGGLDVPLRSKKNHTL